MMRLPMLISLLLIWGLGWVQAQNFEFIRQFKGHESAVSYVTFRSEDNLIVSGDEDGQVLLWDIASGKILHELKQHQGLITHIAFSNNGDWLAVASYDGTISLWELESYRLIDVIQNSRALGYEDLNGDEPSFVAFAPDDSGIYYGGYNLEILYTNFNTGQTNSLFKNRDYAITSGIISPDDQQLVFSYGHTIHFIDLNDPTNQFKMTNPKKDALLICELAFQPEHQSLAAWTYGGALQFWNVKKKKVSNTLQATQQEGTSNMAFSGSGQYLVTGNFGSKTKLWDLASGKIKQILGKHQSEVVTFSYSVDGNYILTGSKDQLINLWKRPMPNVDEPDFELPDINEPDNPSIVESGESDRPNITPQRKPKKSRELNRPSNQPRIVFIQADGSEQEWSNSKEQTDPIEEAAPKPEEFVQTPRENQHEVEESNPIVEVVKEEDEAIREYLESDENADDDVVAEVPISEPDLADPNDQESEFTDPDFSDPEATPPIVFGEENPQASNDSLDRKREKDRANKNRRDKNRTDNNRSKRKVKKEIPAKDRTIQTQHKIRVSSREVELAFWDNQKIDGDSISVNVNGQWVLRHYSLKRSKKRVKVRLNKTTNYIIIHAHNEGSISPNTLALNVIDGNQHRHYSLSSDMKTSGALQIVYDPEQGKINRGSP